MQNFISKQYVTRRMVSLFFSIFAVIFSYGQSVEPYVIKTDIGRFEVQETPKTNLKLEGDTPFMGKYFRLVQFYQLPTDAERKTWELQGLHLVDYVSGNTYFAVIDTSFSLSNIASKIRALLTVSRGFKLETDLQVKGIPAHAKEGSNYRLTLSYYRTLNGTAVINALKAKGIQVGTHRDYSAQIDVVIPAAQWDAVIDLPYIQFVGAVEEAPVREENYSHRNTTGRSNYLNTGFNGLMFNGSGVVIAIGEDGLLSSLIDVKGRTQEVGTSIDVQSHKVGCAQNAGGAGNEDPQDRNNAWGATILSSDGSLNYAGLYNTHQLRYTNHSFGFAISGGYDSAARNHDLRIVGFPNHLVTYSSGNSGTAVGYAPYNFAGWSNITGQVKQNKNHVAIGALSSNDEITGFSSRGPMYDGRIIPQMVIEGAEGTSFAAPKFVGQLAQIAQVYKTKNAGNEPPSSLLRAILMNTSDDMGNPGPDHIHGYGRTNLRRAYTLIDENRFLNGAVSNNQVVSHSISVPANTKQVRVMIVWPDVAAAVNANPAIVNNLNLSLRNPSNVAYNPWVLDTTPNPANLSLPATRGIDAINTIEQVTVDDPQAGNWTVEINGANVPFGPQTYYLVYEFLSDELTMTYPLYNEKLIAGQEYNLRWDSYGSTDTFNLSYELNNSGNWISIVSGYDAAKRTYTWIAPQVSGVASVRFRVQRGSLTSTSQVNYISGTPDNLRVFKACNDVVTLKWSPVTGATSYKVYRLGAQYMEEVTSSITFQGNSAILTGQSTTTNEYYAVSAVTGTFEGQRCLTITKTPGDLNCTGVSWTGIVSSDWFDTNNWASGMLPTASDAIQIPATAPNQPQINGAGAVCASITIDAGASLTMNSTTNYTLNVFGDWINNGNFVRGIGTVAFVNTVAYQEITGTSTTAFHFLQVNKGVTANVVEATSVISLNAPANPLLLTTGTFKLSSNSVITPFTSSSTIGSNAGFWLNGGTVNSGNLSLTLNPGLLRISAGTFNVGTAVSNSITYLNGGTLILEGGVLNVAGRIAPNSGTSFGSFQLSAGEVNVGLQGSTSTTRGLFEISGNCSYQVTGGTITIGRASSSSTADYINLSNSSIVTGGTVKIGGASTPINQTIRINSTVPFFDLEINAFNTPTAQLVSNVITVKNNVSIMGGSLASNNLNVSIQGNWLNHGSFISGNASVIFNGLLPQTISGTTMTTFNNVQVNNPTGLSIQTPQNASVNGILQLTNGVISTGSNVLVITPNGSVNRTLGHVNGNLRKSFSTTTTTQLFEVGDAVMANYTPASLTFNGITNSGTITVSTEPADFAQINSSSLQVNRSVNRNWSVSGSGLTFSNYAAVLTFLTTDLDGLTNTAALQGGVYSGATWNYPSPGVRNANSTELVGITTLGTLQLAENCTDTTSSETISACSSYSWAANGMTYTASGTYTHTTTNASGCSNVATLNLTITPFPTATAGGTASVCAGGSYTLQAGEASATNYASVTWTLNSGSTFPASIEVPGGGDCCCLEGTYTLDGMHNGAPKYRKGATQYLIVWDGSKWVNTEDVIIDVAFYKSNTTGSATVFPTSTWFGNPDVCGGVFTFILSGSLSGVTISNGNSLTPTFNTTSADAGNTYVFTMTAQGEGDCAAQTVSATYTLVVNGATSSTQTETACESYTWAANGMTYTSSGTYTHTTTNASGCPAIATLNLVIQNAQTYYQDADNDGFGTSAVTAISCTGAPVGYVANNTDCNDANAAVFVNGTFYVDADGDGFGASTAAPSTVCVANSSIAPAGFSVNNGDCNDANASIRPGAVDVCYDGIDNDCNGNIDNLGLPGGCTPIVSAIPTATCGTEVAFGGIVYSNWVTGAQGYRFRVTEVNPADDTEIPGTQVIVDMVLRNLFLHNLSNYKYNAKFKVEVAVRFNNVWQPTYSAPCFLLTPTPVSSMIGCGTQVTGINTQIFSTIVQRSNGYRYRIQRLDSSLQPAGPVQEITSGIRNFTFASVTDFRYDANYSVSCAVRNTDGSFLPYGPSCTIQAPKHPTTQVRGTQCNDYAVTSYSERIFADAVQFAAQYRFRLFNEAQVYDFAIDRPLNSFRLSEFVGLIPGETYSVQVAVRMPNQLDFGPYSKTCTLVIPTIARTIEDTSVAAVAFDAQVYPNPFAEQFYFKVATASQASFTIQVYDMMGRAIETRTVNADAIETTEVGANYPAGVYHVILTQGENTKALRVIKR